MSTHASAARFELSCKGEPFYIPKCSLISFFDAHPDLFVFKSYTVHSTVPIDVFREFISSLASDTDIAITADYRGPIALLAAEFCFADLSAECAKLAQNPVSGLESRLAKLEALVLLMVPSGRLEAQEEQLEAVCSSLAQLTTSVGELRAGIAELRNPTEVRIAELKSSLSGSHPGRAAPAPIRPPASAPPARLCEFNGSAPLAKIISHLTAECGGNVHDRGVVEITASSAPDPYERHHYDAKWVADFGDSQEQLYQERTERLLTNVSRQRSCPRAPLNSTALKPSVSAFAKSNGLMAVTEMQTGICRHGSSSASPWPFLAFSSVFS
jgi:hypothetical protein